MGCGLVHSLSEEYSELGRHVGASSIFISNFVLWYEAGYFDRAAELKPLLHLWSLAVEEQFYIILPALLLLTYRRRPFIILGALFAASLLANITLLGSNPSSTFYWLPTRFWQLLLGGLLAYAEHRSIALQRHPLSSSALGITLILIAIFWFTNEMPYPGWRAVLPTFGSALVIMAGQTNMINRHFIGARPLVMLGAISYPLYLWHWPLLAYARLLHAGDPSPTVRVIIVALAVALAWGTYRFIEQPIRFGRYKQRRTIIRDLLLAMFAIGAAGGLTWHFKGFKHNRGFDEAMMTDTEKLDDFRAKQKLCDFSFAKDISWCLVSSKTPPSIAIYGDSHADHLFPGVVDDAARNWLLIGQSSCPPAEGVAIRYMDKPDICVEKNEQILKALIASPTIKTVVLAERGMAYIAKSSLIPNAKKHDNPLNWHVESSYPQEAGLDKATIYRNGMSRTIEKLEKAGKQVILFMDIPELNFHPRRCMPRPISTLAPEGLLACAIPKDVAFGHSAPYYSMMLALAKEHSNAYLYDPTDLLCDKFYCFAGDQTMLFYRDTNHLSLRGSKKVGVDFQMWLKINKL